MICWLLASVVLASHPIAAADFVLEIYGNANMDEYLDDEDVQYLKEIIAGENEATQLSDANFDGAINEEDTEQLQAILDDREEKITYIDILGENETLNKPIPEDERPTAFFEYSSEPYNCYASGSNLGQVLNLAGGRNIIDAAVGPEDPQYKGIVTVDPELIVKENPDYIFEAVASWGDGGYETDDLTKMVASKEQVLNRTELANVNAVKNDRVYCLDYFVLIGSGNNIIGTAYLAKLFYPDLFEDIDPVAIHQEYVDRFCHLDYDVRNHGAFVYPGFEDWQVR